MAVIVSRLSSEHPMDRLLRKRIRPENKLGLKLTARDVELILKETFAEPELTDRLRLVRVGGRLPAYRFTLEELDELGGHVAAAANHARNRKLHRELQHIFERIDEILDRYTDQDEDGVE